MALKQQQEIALILGVLIRVRKNFFLTKYIDTLPPKIVSFALLYQNQCETGQGKRASTRNSDILECNHFAMSTQTDKGTLGTRGHKRKSCGHFLFQSPNQTSILIEYWFWCSFALISYLDNSSYVLEQSKQATMAKLHQIQLSIRICLLYTSPSPRDS